MNIATRYKTLEVPLNDEESDRLVSFCKRTGIPKSVFARLSMGYFIDKDGIPPVCKKESLPRPDIPVASRASAGIVVGGRGYGIGKLPGKCRSGGTGRRVLRV